MGAQTGGAILDAAARITKIAAAVFSQGIQGTIAEQTAELRRVSTLVAGKIFAFFILKKIVIWHSNSPFIMLK